MFLADKASDDGSGIWCSKSTIQRHTELDESTVKRTSTDFLREARLRGRAIPFTDADMTTIRTFAGGLVEFAEAFRILWEAQLAEKAREVDKVLEGVQTKGAEER